MLSELVFFTIYNLVYCKYTVLSVQSGNNYYYHSSLLSGNEEICGRIYICSQVLLNAICLGNYVQLIMFGLFQKQTKGVSPKKSTAQGTGFVKNENDRVLSLSRVNQYPIL